MVVLYLCAGSEDLEEEFAGLPPEEARRRLQRIAEQHDTDNDGQISKDEMYKWITNSFLCVLQLSLLLLEENGQWGCSDLLSFICLCKLYGMI